MHELAELCLDQGSLSNARELIVIRYLYAT